MGTRSRTTEQNNRTAAHRFVRFRLSRYGAAMRSPRLALISAACLRAAGCLGRSYEQVIERGANLYVHTFRPRRAPRRRSALPAAGLRALGHRGYFDVHELFEAELRQVCAATTFRCADPRPGSQCCDQRQSENGYPSSDATSLVSLSNATYTRSTLILAPGRRDVLQPPLWGCR